MYKLRIMNLKKICVCLIIPFLLIVCFPKRVFAINCSGGFGGTVKDYKTQTGIPNVAIQVFIDQQLSPHNITSRSDGGFSFGWPANGNIEIAMIKSGYQSIRAVLPSCTGSTFYMNEVAVPTTPPGTPTPRISWCTSGCIISGGQDPCGQATDGCTQCIGGFCQRPGSNPPITPNTTAVPPTPVPTSTGGGAVYCNNNKGVTTSIGCIPISDINSFAAWMLSKLIYVATGIAFILMVYGAFQITTAGGDAKKVQAGSELISSTIAGILFIILSLLILKIVGIDILKIPGFGQ